MSNQDKINSYTIIIRSFTLKVQKDLQINRFVTSMCLSFPGTEE